MTVETQQISELFKDPRRVQRSQPFNKVISSTFGKGKPPAQGQQPGPGDNDPGPPSKPRPDEAWDGIGRPPGWMTGR